MRLSPVQSSEYTLHILLIDMQSPYPGVEDALMLLSQHSLNQPPNTVEACAARGF